MFELLFTFFLLVLLFLLLSIVWRIKARKYISSSTVASAYDAWTQDKLLERLWGEHIHLGFYPSGKNIALERLKFSLFMNQSNGAVQINCQRDPEFSMQVVEQGEVPGFLRNIMGLMSPGLQLVRLKLKELENLLLMD